MSGYKVKYDLAKEIGKKVKEVKLKSVTLEDEGEWKYAQFEYFTTKYAGLKKVPLLTIRKPYTYLKAHPDYEIIFKSDIIRTEEFPEAAKLEVEHYCVEGPPIVGTFRPKRVRNIDTYGKYELFKEVKEKYHRNSPMIWATIGMTFFAGIMGMASLEETMKRQEEEKRNYSTKVRDVNGDGLKDIIKSYENGEQRILLQRKDGSYEPL